MKINRLSEMMIYQDEVEVLLSVMSDRELLDLEGRVEYLVKEDAYQTPNFPLSLGGLNYLLATIKWAYWGRKERGVRIDKGEVVLCKLEESPFYLRYQLKMKRGGYYAEGGEYDGGGVKSGASKNQTGEVRCGESENKESEGEEDCWV